MNITGFSGTINEYRPPKARSQTGQAACGEAKEELVKYNGNQEKAVYATVYDFYEKEAANAKSIANSEDISADKKLITYYQGKSLEEWSKTDPCYTDAETGIKWYVRDGKQPYMTGEDSEKFYALCEESGEFPLKKFAEMTGTIQYLDENTVAYICDNGTAIKGKDGSKLFVDTSGLTYDMLMKLFSNLTTTANYFDEGYWTDEIEKLKELTSVSNADTEEMVDYAKILDEKINEIFAKIQNGDTEASYQIGSQSFTEKEWEEFLDKFDSVEEVIQELMKEEQDRKEAGETKKEDVFTNDASTLLTTESTSCVYETADPDDDDIRYITWYTEEGIFCRKAGQTEGYEWSIAFENREQYDKVMEFIGQLPSDWNMRFAAHENFWNDFLNDEIDMDGFMEFINGTKK